MKIKLALGMHHTVHINPKTDPTDRLLLAYFATNHRQHNAARLAIGKELVARFEKLTRSSVRQHRTAA